MKYVGNTQICGMDGQIQLPDKLFAPPVTHSCSCNFWQLDRLTKFVVTMGTRVKLKEIEEELCCIAYLMATCEPFGLYHTNITNFLEGFQWAISNKQHSVSWRNKFGVNRVPYDIEDQMPKTYS